MNIIQALILGIVQGLTEFLPISSTAHLTLAGKIMGLISTSNPEQWTAFMATIQLGTLVAVIIYFLNEIKLVSLAFFMENLGSGKLNFSNQSNNSKLGWMIIIGSVPLFTIGFLLKKIIEGNLTKSLTVIASSLIGVALILFLAERIATMKKDIKDITLKDAFIIGLFQCIALIPGSSRSGSTIMGGLFMGLKRETAARFSFLLSIPAVLASGLYEFYKSYHYLTSGDMLTLLISTVVAGITGYMAIAFLLNYLKTRTTNIFVVYRVVLGLIIFILIFKGIV